MHDLASGGFLSITPWPLPLGILVSLMKSGIPFQLQNSQHKDMSCCGSLQRRWQPPPPHCEISRWFGKGNVFQSALGNRVDGYIHVDLLIYLIFLILYITSKFSSILFSFLMGYY